MTEEKKEEFNVIHVVLGHSYLFYFAGLLVALLFDTFTHFPITNTHTDNQLGIVLLVVGTMLIYWAQKTTRTGHHRKEDLPYTRFARGPYKVTRSPTHMGIGIMLLGLALIFNSLALLVSTVICFFITRYIFIRKEETLLVDRYGDDYRAYQKKVRF